MTEPARPPGSTALFVVVGVVALLLVALVVGGAALFLRRPPRVAAAAAPVAGPPSWSPIPSLEASAVTAPTIATSTAPDPSSAPADVAAVKPPRAGLGAPTTTGSLPPDVVRRVVLRHMGSIRFCYEQGLKSDPSLAGKVTIRFVVATDGSVASASESSSTLHAPAVTACIVRTFEAMEFPAPSGGIANVTYPLVFASAGP